MRHVRSLIRVMAGLAIRSRPACWGGSRRCFQSSTCGHRADERSLGGRGPRVRPGEQREAALRRQLRHGGVGGSTFGATADGQWTPQEAGWPGSGCRAACSRRLHGHPGRPVYVFAGQGVGDFVGPVALTELADLGVAGTEAFHATNKIRDGALHLDGDKLAVQTLPQVDGLTPLRPGHPPAATRRLGPGRSPASRRDRPGRAQGDYSCISRIEDAKALRVIQRLYVVHARQRMRYPTH